MKKGKERGKVNMILEFFKGLSKEEREEVLKKLDKEIYPSKKRINVTKPTGGKYKWYKKKL